MNKLSLLIFIVSIGLFACGEATTDRDDTTASTDAQEMQTEQQKDRSVEQIINHNVEKLDEKMLLSPETKSQIKSIYTNAYVAQGGSLDDRINQDEISDFRIEIVNRSKNDVMEILDENQRRTYNQLFDQN